MFLYRLFFLYTCSWIVFICGRKDTIKYKGIRRYLYKNHHKKQLPTGNEVDSKHAVAESAVLERNSIIGLDNQIAKQIYSK